MQNKKAHNVNNCLKNALDALETYNAATVQYAEINDEIAIDLIMDLLHYCAHKDRDPRMIFVEALEYYHAEKYEHLSRPNRSER